jgi:hypothetical protein
MSETNQSVDGGLATVSSSTNAYNYAVVIQSDGSAKATIKGILDAMVSIREFPAGTINTKRLLSLLTEIGDVSRIPTGTTEISYAGKTSGNLESIPQQASGGDESLLRASKALARFVRKTLDQLKL